MPRLSLTPDELLSTTRSVRKRLDLSRPVEREVIEECLLLAQQAPTGGNRQNWHFVVVTDAERRAALAELYRGGAEAYFARPDSPANAAYDDPARAAQQARVFDSARYLVDHMHEVPVHVVACIEGRTDGKSLVAQAGPWGSIAPAVWSFMLAARAHGLGTVWTTFHLLFEEEAAHLLHIPFERVMQVALVPVAYTVGTDFKPAPREPLERMAHWDRW